jgi:phage-related minor tail protein
MEKGMSKFFRDLPTELENGQRAFESVVGNMEQALDNFVKTGKMSFKDLARSIIQEIIAIQLKAQASNLLGMFMKSFGFGGGGGSGSYSQGVSGYGSEFADGGSPTPNTINLVGERGPELFIPKTAGTIVPNHALSGMGSTTNVTNNYINAIDTKSFEDRLLGSPTAVWAANQYGAKSLATNFGRT